MIMKLGRILLSLVIVLVFCSCRTEDLGETLEIEIISITRNSVTLAFSHDYISVVYPNEISFGEYDFLIDVFLEDDEMVSEFKLGHYDYLFTSDRVLTMVVTGYDDAYLSGGEFDVKVYEGDFIDPDVIVDTEDFTFGTPDGTASFLDILPASNSTTEGIYVTVAESTADGEFMDDLVAADFTLYQDGEPITFSFMVASDFDSDLPDNEYRIAPVSGVFANGQYHIRFDKQGYNPDIATISFE